ncbi:group 10 secretory phospholipase A2 [Paramormyrops kingsleyae]|uniref:Phospholipase A2 n=1 Tax=Paramormyrops kingsleyae TaxID=1676925 RepID=A0A3B3QM69_9TELE|nr:phospholipase A2-like [Paramormyrops kingsleyae]XP_023654266.1 phospholipase A2-like [Paramormyrops kingsleyae]XP_023654267.1 phospholipase A2-like [Paramormyrops kingsleyae]
MLALHFMLLLLSVHMAFLSPGRYQRSKRGLLELAGVIKCSTGKSALAYMMYGCYCGLGGQGWPRDRADWCCHKHDCCYEQAEFAGCQTKTDTYKWTCDDNVADCDYLNDRCEKILCRCDREAANCLKKAPYIRKYALWPDFLCGCDHPTCNYY